MLAATAEGAVRSVRKLVQQNKGRESPRIADVPAPAVVVSVKPDVTASAI